MSPEFWQAVQATQGANSKRPDVQAHARAIQQSIKPISQRERQGGLAYPLPGKGVSGESSN